MDWANEHALGVQFECLRLEDKCADDFPNGTWWGHGFGFGFVLTGVSCWVCVLVCLLKIAITRHLCSTLLCMKVEGCCESNYLRAREKADAQAEDVVEAP